ncbi:MAG TPA: hypothetical protein PL001_12120, partial [Candidatus Kryptobacter bacterium]|nr:hypothetical protein [Candidatus Kryptobacter bacterium]
MKMCFRSKAGITEIREFNHGRHRDTESNKLPILFASVSRWFGFFPALFLFALLVSGCAMSTGFYKNVDADVSANRFEKAAAVVKANREKYGNNSSVLYNLEEGLLLHYAGDYSLSTEHLAAGEQEMDELYTKSISKIAGSFVLNDNELPYQGEDFEKVYVNLFMALNYAELGKLEDAIVEARKVDLKLNEYSQEYAGKNSFKQDAF